MGSSLSYSRRTSGCAKVGVAKWNNKSKLRQYDVNDLGLLMFWPLLVDLLNS